MSRESQEEDRTICIPLAACGASESHSSPTSGMPSASPSPIPCVSHPAHVWEDLYCHVAHVVRDFPLLCSYSQTR
eukprot:758639-Hanusia_phi.AAC.1